MEDKTGTEERVFEAVSAAGIFGAPISWVALVGALMGALAIVPFIFYPFGGGFMSAGMGVFGPIGGMLLGPWAGAIAGFIGGFIGMMISPGAYPLGFVDVFLSGVFFPVNNVPVWLEVISKINPLTYGVDAIRQVFLSVNLASAGGEMTGGTPPIGVTVFGHTMTILDDALVVAALGIILLVLAVWSFNKQE